MMRVAVTITTDDGAEIRAELEATGKYAPDILNDLTNRAYASLHAAWSAYRQTGEVEQGDA